MRQALELTAAARTQAEIGRILNCSPRTVRDLLKEGRARQVATFRSRSAEAVVADVEHRAAVNYGRWTSLLVRARNSGDIRAEALVLARMDAALVSRVAMLARVGFFDSVTFSTGDDAEADHKARSDRKQIKNLVAMSAALNRGEDMSAFELGADDSADLFNPADPIY